MAFNDPSASTLLVSGTVVRSFPDQRVYDVTTDEGFTELNCLRLATGIFAPFFGFKTVGALADGTKVLLLRGTPGIIIGCLDVELPDLKSAAVGKATVGDCDVRDLSEEATGHAMGSRAMLDMVEGEFAVANALQVGLYFLTTMMKLQASDRAKIECCLVNDLVRVVSGSFQHLSDFGNHEIYNDNGRINVRWQGTSYDHEAWGVQDKEPRIKGTVSGALPDDPVATTGRWRFSTFLGQMGDFVQIFLHDPVSLVGELAQSYAGKFHQHVNQDGTYIVQSVADIVFEQVTRIVVPQELRRVGDPEGDGPEEPSTDFLDTWRMDPARPWTLAFHMREYARWLNSYHAYSRFLRRSKDWSVSSEAESPEASYACGEKDKERAIPAAQRKPRVTYSCYRLMRDGSQVMLNGYGASSMMAGGTICHSAPLDIRLEAGRDIVMVAGRSIFAKAFKHIEMAAVTGAFLAKARTRVAVWCEKGTVLLRSLMTRGAPEDPSHHRFTDDRVGVVVDAPQSDALLSAGGQITLEGTGKDVDDEQAGVVLASGKHDIQLRTAADKAIRMVSGLLAGAADNIAWIVKDSLSMIGPSLNFGDVLAKVGGAAVATTLKANALQGKTILHGTELRNGFPPHVNHVGFGNVDASMPDRSGSIEEAQQNRPPPMAGDKSLAERVRPICDFLPPSEYPTDVVHQSLAQQIATVSPGVLHPAGLNFEVWEFASDGDSGDEQASSKLPYPGPRGQMEVYGADATLHVPSPKSPTEFVPTPTASETKPAAHQRWKSS